MPTAFDVIDHFQSFLNCRLKFFVYFAHVQLKVLFTSDMDVNKVCVRAFPFLDVLIPSQRDSVIKFSRIVSRLTPRIHHRSSCSLLFDI